MKPIRKIDLTSVSDKLPETAYGLFRYWTAAVGLSSELIIRTEEVLVADLRTILEEAIIALKDKEVSETKAADWDVGFVLGFIEGGLLQLWQHEYVNKNNEPYQAFIALRAVALYLEADELVRISINRLYTELLESNSNIANQRHDVTRMDLNVKTREMYPSGTTGQVSALLNNLALRQIKISVETRSNIRLPVEDYFSAKEVRLLIDRNP